MQAQQIQKESILSEILLELYSDSKKDDKFYLIENMKENEVRSNIFNKLKERKIKESGVMDMYIFTSQMGNDVLIKELEK